MPEHRRAVIAWSAGISAVAAAFAGIIGARATAAPLWSPQFIACVVVALVAVTILLVAGIPDLLSWLRRAGPGEATYWATVREIRQRTGVLAGRQQELAWIAGFATSTEGFRWLAAEVWAGKTALLAEAALRVRGDVDVICYFASRREGDADSSRFLAAVVPQLARLMGEGPLVPAREEFRALWRRAADRAAAKGRHLLLVVDGLDEDLHPPGLPSIAAELPVMAGKHAHVLVSSRLHYQLPADVLPGHPLAGTRPQVVAPFARAQEMAGLARQEIDDLLRRDDGDGLAADVLGLLAAAAGALTVQDLAALTSVAPLGAALRRRIRTLLTGSAARSFQRAGPPGAARYQFAHESLLAYAQAHEDLNDPDFRHRIHQWAEGWQAAGWPIRLHDDDATPRYLLDAYPSTLINSPERLSGLTADVGWIEAVVAFMGVDRALADLRRAAAANPGSTRVSTMLAALTGQALNLRPPDPLDQPGYILRQLCMQAAGLGTRGSHADPGHLAASRLADDIRGRLRSVPGPGLVLQWTTQVASRALSGELGRHGSSIRAVAVLADGRVAAADEEHILVWDPANPGLGPLELSCHGGASQAEARLADGRVITAQPGKGRRPLLHDPAHPTAKPVEFGGPISPARYIFSTGMALLPDGRAVKFEADTVSVWEALHNWRGRVMNSPVSAVAAGPDGQVIIGLQDGSVEVWDQATPDAQPHQVGHHEGVVSAVAVLPDGRVVTGGHDRRVLAWNLDARGPLPGKFGGTLNVSALVFTRDGRLVTGSEQSIWIWDWDADGPRSGQMEGIDEYPQAVAVLPDGRVVTAGLNTRVLLWDPAHPSVPVTELGRHTDYVMAVAVLPDGRVVTGGFDGQVLLWDPANPAAGAVGLGFTNRRVLAVAVLPDGRAVTSGTDGRVLVWDPASPGASPGELGQHGCRVRSLAVLPDGRVVTGGFDDGRILIWDPGRPGSAPAELGQHNGQVLAAVALPDGRVVTSGSDGRVLVWDTATASTPVLQLSCPARRLTTTTNGQGKPCLAIAHEGSGFSLWSFTDNPEATCIA